jgi:hypothetical protein
MADQSQGSDNDKDSDKSPEKCNSDQRKNKNTGDPQINSEVVSAENVNKAFSKQQRKQMAELVMSGEPDQESDTSSKKAKSKRKKKKNKKKKD